MKKHKPILVFFLLALLMAGCKASIDIFPTSVPTNLGVKIALRNGTIFTEQYPVSNLGLPGVDLGKRFTPTKANIEETEVVLREQVIGMGKSHVGHYKNYPVGGASNKYFMQYVWIY